MKLPIYLYGHPVLRRKCADVQPGYEGLAELIDNMFDTMYGAEGVGLAGPQIGRSDRIVVIDADPLADSFPECKGWKKALINPEVEVLDGEKTTRGEGCLSLPGLSENVARVEHIRLRWLDPDMQPHEEEISGFLARIVQHECDHLEGTVYTDRISPIRKQLVKGKLNSIAAGRTACDYPVRTSPRRK